MIAARVNTKSRIEPIPSLLRVKSYGVCGVGDASTGVTHVYDFHRHPLLLLMVRTDNKKLIFFRLVRSGMPCKTNKTTFLSTYRYFASPGDHDGAAEEEGARSIDGGSSWAEFSQLSLIPKRCIAHPSAGGGGSQKSPRR